MNKQSKDKQKNTSRAFAPYLDCREASLNFVLLSYPGEDEWVDKSGYAILGSFRF
ncbi:MAG: hypothetical protein SVW51_16505 [Pseudomonadota bacterium]|nr:hypothetical protein [Pseudomonadota bacterium]